MKKLLFLLIICLFSYNWVSANCEIANTKIDKIWWKIFQKYKTNKIILWKIHSVINWLNLSLFKNIDNYFKCELNGVNSWVQNSCTFNWAKKYTSLYLTKKEVCAAEYCNNIWLSQKDKVKKSYIDYLKDKKYWVLLWDKYYSNIISTTIKMYKEAYTEKQWDFTNSNIYTPDWWKSFKVYLPAWISDLWFSNNPVRQEEELLRNLTFVPDGYNKKVTIDRVWAKRIINKRNWMEPWVTYSIIRNDVHTLPNKFNKPLNIWWWLYLDVVNIWYAKYLNSTAVWSKPSRDFSLYIFLSMMWDKTIFLDNINKIKTDSDWNPVDNNCIEIIDTPRSGIISSNLNNANINHTWTASDIINDLSKCTVNWCLQQGCYQLSNWNYTNCKTNNEQDHNFSWWNCIQADSKDKIVYCSEAYLSQYR